MPIFILCLVAAVVMVGPQNLVHDLTSRQAAEDKTIAAIPLEPAFRPQGCEASVEARMVYACPNGQAGEIVFRASCEGGRRLVWSAESDTCGAA